MILCSALDSLLRLVLIPGSALHTLLKHCEDGPWLIDLTGEEHSLAFDVRQGEQLALTHLLHVP